MGVNAVAFAPFWWRVSAAVAGAKLRRGFGEDAVEFAPDTDTKGCFQE